MAEGVLDVVIFGATGYTGKHVIRELLKHVDLPNGGKRTVGIAGRSRAKLTSTLSWALNGEKAPVEVEMLEADVGEPESIKAMCRRARVLLNCVGPFRTYGEPVVAACVEAGVDYLDVSGEPEFIEKMEAKYDELAQQHSSLVISACGYDSIPAEFGVMFNNRQFNLPACPHSVNSYITVKNDHGPAIGNTGTWESLVLGIGFASQLQEFRKSRPRLPKLPVPGTRPVKTGLVHWEKYSRSWGVKLPSCDAMQVRRTLAKVAQYPNGLPSLEDDANTEVVVDGRQTSNIKPVYYGCYFCSPNLLGVFASFIFGLVLVFLAQFKRTRSLLLKYPELFSGGHFRKNGPKPEDLKNTTFQMWFVGKGYSNSNDPKVTCNKPDLEIVTRLSGPEIGYVTTPICLVQSALIVLDDRKTLPKGGVLTPGFVLGNSDLQQRLERSGVTFEVISKRHI